MIVLPAIDSPDYRFGLTLDGKPLQFVTRWNTRGEHWTLELRTKAEEPIVAVKVCFGVDILGGYTDERLPKGELVAVDTTGKLNTIGRDALHSGTVQLVYITEGEINALRTDS